MVVAHGSVAHKKGQGLVVVAEAARRGRTTWSPGLALGGGRPGRHSSRAGTASTSARPTDDLVATTGLVQAIS